MTFVLWLSAGFTLASLVVTVLVWLVLRLVRRRGFPYWRRAFRLHAMLVPLYVLVFVPVFMGLFGVARIGTRGDERGYEGPRLDAEGRWILQSRASLAAEAKGGETPDPAVLAAARARAVHFSSDDGVPLPAFLVPARTGTPRATVLLVHGLFRGALELEAPASMFRELGAETLLLEMRNHGRSGRAPPTFGWNERRDVQAAVAWLRANPERADRPLLLFAVSLGTAAVLRAAPDLPGLAGLVLDAPVDDLLRTAHRMLQEGSRKGRPGPALPQPFRSLALTVIEWKAGFAFADVRPIDDARRLPPTLPVLLISASGDTRLPPATARALFEALPSAAPTKELWIYEGSDHGQIWTDDPDAYRARLPAFFSRALR